MFYTPTFVVDYIVENTVGISVAGKSPRQLEKLKILDPACGSGTFLLQAYQFLLDYHLEWYTQHGLEKHAKGRIPKVTQTIRGEWRLSTPERKKILLNSIFGVDVDSQAVEVTKLSLLLKVLEGETEQSLTQQMSLFHQRALPDLDDNIKCGNTLIDFDYFHGTQQSMFDDEERYKVNAFNWPQAFPFFDSTGFDCIIGNPPYIRSQSLGAPQRNYYSAKYTTATATYDIYVLFMEKAHSLLTKKTGHAGFIIPNKFFTTDYGQGLRELFVKEKSLARIVDFEAGQVFEKAGIYTCLAFFGTQPNKGPEYAPVGQAYTASGRKGLAQALESPKLAFEPFEPTSDGSRWTMATGEFGEILQAAQRNEPPLLDWCPHIFQGLKTSADKIYMLVLDQISGDTAICRNVLGVQCEVEKDCIQRVVKGEDVQPFYSRYDQCLHILYPYKPMEGGKARLLGADEMKARYPKAWAYLRSYQMELGSRDKGKWATRNDWYAYARPQNIATFLQPKFMLPYMVTNLRADYDEEGTNFFVNITTGGYGLTLEFAQHHPYYVLALLNSDFLNKCLRQMTNHFRGGYFAVNKQALERLPLHKIDFEDSQQRAAHDRVVETVARIRAIHSDTAGPKDPHSIRLKENETADLTEQMNKTVDALYKVP